MFCSKIVYLNSTSQAYAQGFCTKTCASRGFDLKYSFGRATGSFKLDAVGKFTTTSFFDRYDFDAKAWGTRTFMNELITRGYNIYSSGKAFNIIYNGK
jgi:hypothetical protein